MHKVIKTLGLLLAAEGVLFTVFSKDYLKLYRTDKLGPTFEDTIDTILKAPDKTFRLAGVAEILIGVGAVIVAARINTGSVKHNESSRRSTAQSLRTIADSIERSAQFELIIEGKRVVVPAEAKTKIEFEAKDGGGKLEFEIKW
ncbi:MAG TPA: amphi-Trp domain-containing protein [Candidatus Aquicultor sp.]